MSLTTTTTTTTMYDEDLSDLQRRLQPAPTPQVVRFRGAAPAAPASPAAPISTPASTPHASLGRRFSFVWPFISKDHTAGTGPYLRSRCSQLLRQFPAFLSSDQSSSVRDLISRVLSQLKAVWLVLAVYLSLVALTCLSSAVLYTFLLANKPLGLWFLVGCILATGAIAGVSFTARERPARKQPRAQPKVQLQVQPKVQTKVQLQVQPKVQPKVLVGSL